MCVGLGASGEIEKQRSDVVSFTCVFFPQYVASSTVLNATKSLERGSRPARKERTAVVEA